MCVWEKHTLRYSLYIIYTQTYSGRSGVCLRLTEALFVATRYILLYSTLSNLIETQAATGSARTRVATSAVLDAEKKKQAATGSGRTRGNERSSGCCQHSSETTCFRASPSATRPTPLHTSRRTHSTSSPTAQLVVFYFFFAESLMRTRRRTRPRLQWVVCSFSFDGVLLRRNTNTFLK